MFSLLIITQGKAQKFACAETPKAGQHDYTLVSESLSVKVNINFAAKRETFLTDSWQTTNAARRALGDPEASIVESTASGFGFYTSGSAKLHPLGGDDSLDGLETDFDD